MTRETHIRDGDGGDNLAIVQSPQTQSVGLLNAQSRDGLQNAERDDKVRGEDEVLLKVDTQAVRAELLSKNVELAFVSVCSGKVVDRQKT